MSGVGFVKGKAPFAVFDILIKKHWSSFFLLRYLLKSRLVECTLDGEEIPDMSVNFGSRINRPLRALVLEKV